MIARYFAERFPPLFFGPVALVIALSAGAGRSSVRDVALDVVFILIALAHFRLWDDLADRASDAVTHPERVLVRAASVAPFIAVCVALGAATLAIAIARDGAGLAAAVVAGLQIILALFYAFRGRRSALGDCVLLAKYPLLLVAAAGDRAVLSPAPVVVAALAAYAAACAYEAWHDPAAFSMGGQ